MRFIIFFITSLLSFSVYAGDFSLTSSAFKNNQSIPSLYSCTGKNISPPLAWTNPPTNTHSFALIVSDPDAPLKTFYHWVVFNIPSDTSKIEENNLPAHSTLGKNSTNQNNYFGPCPPKGIHRYIFTLYALDNNLTLKEDATIENIQSEINNHLIAKTELIGKYQKT